MIETIEMQQELYVKELERLLIRRSDIVEMTVIKDAVVRRWNSIEAAKSIAETKNRRIRQHIA